MTAQKKRTRENPIPLIIEDHPLSYNGYPFITLIQHRNQHVLSIVDNADDKTIRAFILDLCGPERVDEALVINTAAMWFYTHKQKYPLSFEFSRLGMTDSIAKIYRTYNVEFITRVIGPLPKYDMSSVQSIKRRRRKPVPPGIEIRKKIIKLA